MADDPKLRVSFVDSDVTTEVGLAVSRLVGGSPFILLVCDSESKNVLMNIFSVPNSELVRLLGEYLLSGNPTQLIKIRRDATKREDAL